MGIPLPCLHMCGELRAPVANAVVLRAAAEQVLLPKISTYELLPSFATALVTADFCLYWEGE